MGIWTEHELCQWLQNLGMLKRKGMATAMRVLLQNTDRHSTLSTLTGQDKKDKERNKGTLERAWRNACYLQDSCSNRKDHFPLQRRAGPRQATGSNKTQRLLTQPFTASLKLTAKRCSNLISLSVPACPASREPGKLLKPVSSSTLPPFT